ALSPGATPVHVELVAVLVSLGEAEAAVKHAERALALEGKTARAYAVLATALLAARRFHDAQRAIDRSLALDPSDEAPRALAERIRSKPAARSILPRVRARFKK